MKIAFVIGLYPNQIGGAEMQAREIAIALKKRGHSIYYVCYSGAKYTSEEYDVTIIDAKSKWDIFYNGTKRKLYNALDKIKPDLVYHRAFVPYSRFVAQWCYQHKVPFYFHSADVYTLIRKNNTPYNVIENYWLKYTLEHATGIICQNKEQFEALRKFKLKKKTIIYNIQRKNTCPINKNKRKNVVWIAKFEPAKQPEVFVNLAEHYPDKDVTFTMFSSKCPKTGINESILKRIKACKQITLIEGKDNTFINEYLCNTATVLVNTSVSEGISNTFIQAWMRGVPVVSLNSNPDGWFDNNLIGGCCNGDTEKIEDFVTKIMSEKEYSKYSRASITFAESNFSPEVVIPQMEKLMLQ